MLRNISGEVALFSPQPKLRLTSGFTGLFAMLLVPPLILSHSLRCVLASSDDGSCADLCLLWAIH